MSKIKDEVAAEWAFDPERFGPVMTAIWESIKEQLADGGWHPLADVRAPALESGANPRTVDNMLRNARKARFIVWRGGYSHKTRIDTREIALRS